MFNSEVLIITVTSVCNNGETGDMQFYPWINVYCRKPVLGLLPHKLLSERSWEGRRSFVTFQSLLWSASKNLLRRGWVKHWFRPALRLLHWSWCQFSKVLISIRVQFSGDLKSELIWIFNGQKEVSLHLVYIFNQIWYLEAQHCEIQTNGRHFVKNHMLTSWFQMVYFLNV